MENSPTPQGEKNLADQQSKDRINNGFWELIYGLGEFFGHLFRLDEDLDREGTIENIKNNKKMEGANVWLLVCSIMVASIGLDINSQAVIIGAMLISPLMSPILGVGLGIGINDRETLYISMRHFGIAIIIALTTSIFYFVISPYGEMTEQIEARTVPTFLDALVAVFGGLAGIVSSSRKDKSNAIPGVAIATALMPPLCVAGFGIANGNWSVFINSFYLFFLNSFFIALTTYFIVRLLRFPYTSYMSKREKQRTTFIITIFSIAIIIPSAFILYNVWRGLKQQEDITTFMNKEFTTDSRDYLSHKIVNRDTLNYIFIDYYSNEVESISDADIAYYQRRLGECGILNPRIIPRGTSNAEVLLDKELGKIQEKSNQELDEYAARVAEKDRKIRELELRADSIEKVVTLKAVVQEAKVFMPHLKDIDLVESKFDDVPILLIEWEDDLFNSKIDREKLMEFVKIKTKLDTLVVKGI